MIGSKADNLAFLLSMPRSGSTLLSLMLGSHPEICCPPEPWIVLAVAEYLDLGNVRSAPYGREYAEMAAIEFLLDPERKRRGTLGAFFHDAGAAAGLAPLEGAKRILEAAYRMHLDASGKRVLVDKTPRYYAVLDLIDEIFPRSRKIVLLRNPLDIFSSYKSTWGVTRAIFEPDSVTVLARDFCEGLIKFADYISVSREDLLFLRYEELASHPEKALRSVCEFVGIDFSPAMLAYHENFELIEEYGRSPVGDPIVMSRPEPANNRTANAWEHRLDPEDIQALINVLGLRIFDRLGYGDTAIKLRDLLENIPTEEQALENRTMLMQALVERVQESPYSLWESFISPLKKSEADQTALQADRAALQAENEILKTLRGSAKFWLARLRRKLKSKF